MDSNNEKKKIGHIWRSCINNMYNLVQAQSENLDPAKQHQHGHDLKSRAKKSNLAITEISFPSVQRA